MISVMSRMSKSSSRSGRKVVPLAQQAGDLLDGLGDLLRAGRLGQDLVDVDEPHRLRRVGGLRSAKRPDRAASRRDRDCSSVLIVVDDASAATALVLRAPMPLTRNLIVVQGASTMSSWSWPIMLAPLRAQHADHPEGDVLDADFLADGRFVLKQLALDGGADQADLVAVADVAVGEACRPRPCPPSRARPDRPAWCRSWSRESSCDCRRRPGRGPRRSGPRR